MQLRFAALMQRPDADELLDELTGEEWEEWKAFYRVEPWGGPPEDARLGLVVAFLAAWCGKQLDPGNVFSWQRKQLEPPEDVEVRRAQWMAYAASQPRGVIEKAK